VDELRGLGRTLLEWNGVPFRAPRWQSVSTALGEAGLSRLERPWYPVALVEVAGDWSDYFAGRSRNHRQHIRKVARRAEKFGPLELDYHEQTAPGEVEPLLRACFEVEASGWKGAGASAVLRVPGVWEIYLNQARQLAAWGQLRVAVLRLAGKCIAFEYGWQGKGVLTVLKVGYDEQFGPLSPGQLLRYLLLERLFAQRSAQWIDYSGPISTATAQWATHQYEKGRIAVGAGLAGRVALAARRHGGPLWRKLRARGESPGPRELARLDEPPAASFEPAELAEAAAR
jgi:CelD/BcsL family acetyltransferase involved in cellulose biosynthesis